MDLSTPRVFVETANSFQEYDIWSQSYQPADESTMFDAGSTITVLI